MRSRRVFPPEFGDSAHFCLFAHDIDTTAHYSGIARTIPGRDLIVSLGGFTNHVGTDQEKAGTLMHELGHALGLRHGGIDDINYKPNYVSVMNYSFQMDGVPILGTQGNYDYSRFTLPCDERNLDETIGLTTDPLLRKYGTMYYCGGVWRSLGSISSTQTGWDCDGRYRKSVATDVNADQQVSLLAGADDWQILNLAGAPASTGTGPESQPGPRPGDELTPAKADEVPLMPVAGLQAEARGGGVLLAWRRIPLDRVLAYGVYRAGITGSPVPVAIVDAAGSPTFTDVALKDSAEYSCTAVYAPDSCQLQRGGESARPVAGGSVTSRTDLKAILEIGVARLRQFATIGAAGEEARASATFPSQLLETDPSPPIRVRVK